MAGSASYPEGASPLVSDPEQRLLVKICDATILGGGGGGGGGSTNHIGAFLDPNGNVLGSVGDQYISAISLGGDGLVWWKTSGTLTSTGWE